MNGSLGIITSGCAANLVDSALEQLESRERFSVLKLGVIPTEDKIIESFLEGMNQVLLVEIGEPLIEQQVRRLSNKPIFGKMSGHVIYVGQMQVDELTEVLGKFMRGLDSEKQVHVTPAFQEVVGRPLFGDMKGDPVMCPGCPGIGLQYSLKKVKERHDFLVFCDNGCVAFGGFPPYDTLDYGTCMGGSIGAAQGAYFGGKKGVALIGDSAFMHSGLGGLINMVNNGSKATIIIFDNLSTAMSGRQPNPSTGKTIGGQKTERILMEEVCEACGIEEVNIIDPYDLEVCQEAIEKAVTEDEISVLIARKECALLPGINYGRARIDSRKCTLCMDCVREIRCPALNFKEKIEIDEKCVGCLICAQVCPEGAIGLL